jgi:hypothetical protein
VEVTLPCVQVLAVSEDLGSAGALRAISKRLTANDILVMFVLHTMAMLTKNCTLE